MTTTKATVTAMISALFRHIHGVWLRVLAYLRGRAPAGSPALSSNQPASPDELLRHALARQRYDSCTDYANHHPHRSVQDLIAGLGLAKDLEATFLAALLREATQRNEVELLARGLLVRILVQLEPSGDRYGGLVLRFETAFHRLARYLPASYYASCMRVAWRYRQCYRKSAFLAGWMPVKADDAVLMSLFETYWAGDHITSPEIPALHPHAGNADRDDDDVTPVTPLTVGL